MSDTLSSVRTNMKEREMTAAPAGELKAPEANNPFEENTETSEAPSDPPVEAKPTPKKRAPKAATKTVVEGEILAEVKHERLPLSAVVGDVFGIVKVNPAGIVVLEVSMHGFIGVEPVAVPVEQASDIEKVVQTLRDQAASL